MAIKKSRYRVHNGGSTNTASDYDTIHYETSEDMVIGQVQLLASTGYRVHSGGLVEQWGVVADVTNGWKNVRYPIEFPKECINIQLTEIADTGGASQTFIQTSTSNRKDLFACKHEGSTARKFFWIAKGY